MLTPIFTVEPWAAHEHPRLCWSKEHVKTIRKQSFASGLLAGKGRNDLIFESIGVDQQAQNRKAPATKEIEMSSGLHWSHSTFDCENSRQGESESVLPQDMMDSFSAILELEQTLLSEVEMEPLPAGMLCPIRSVCPDRGRKTPLRIFKCNKA